MGHGVDDAHEAVAHLNQGIAQLDKVAIVGHIAACGAQVYDGPGFGCHIAEGVDVGHDIVAELLFVIGHFGEVDVVQVGGHFLHLILRNGQAKLVFRPGQG